MVLIVRILGLALAAASAASAAEREVTKKFAVQPGWTLQVDSYRGQIVVEESEALEIAVTVRLETGIDSEPEATRIFDAVQLEVGTTGNTVAIRARNPAETRALWIWEKDRQVDLSYKITVPRACSVDLKLGSGKITVGNLAGRHVARARDATIFFKRIEGSVDVQADTGLVIVSRCSGAVTARLRQGTIRLGTIGGRVEATNTSGDIDVLQAKGGIVAEAVAGDIAVGFPDELGTDNRVRASGGSIRAKVDAAAKCSIEASSVWGRVTSTMPFAVETGGFGKRKVTGRLNEGGPLISLHANGGDVTIVPMDFEID